MGGWGGRWEMRRNFKPLQEPGNPAQPMCIRDFGLQVLEQVLLLLGFPACHVAAPSPRKYTKSKKTKPAFVKLPKFDEEEWRGGHGGRDWGGRRGFGREYGD